jgi:tetratricopeptide (TPR) repeat protein
MSELDVIGALAGTDKASSVSWSWDYLRHYEELFRPFRYQDINFIEIGVASGASLAAWTRYFDRAKFVGIDVNPECRRYAWDRVAIRIGSQEDPGFLHAVAAEFPPTIVIDDGSHVAHHMIASFETLFPALLPGGVYVFEDLAFHFNESGRRFQDASAHQGLSDTHIFDYLNKFMRARAAAVEAPDKTWGFDRYAFEQIDSVTVANGFIAVRKKAPRDVQNAVAIFENELNNNYNNRNEAAYRYAEYLIKHEINLDRAASLLPEILAAEPRDEPMMSSLLDVLIRLERFDEAADTAYKLVRIGRSNAGYWDKLAMIERRRNRPEQEVAALTQLAELQPKAAGHHHRLSELHEQLNDLPAALAEARHAAELEPAIADFRERVAALERR